MLLHYSGSKKEHGSCEIKDVDRWIRARTYYLHTYMGFTPKSKVMADDTTYIISWETWVVYITGVNTEHRDD